MYKHILLYVLTYEYIITHDIYIYMYIYIYVYIYTYLYNIWEVLLYGRKLLDSDPASELHCVAEAYNQKKKEEEEKEAEEAISNIFFN